MSLPRPTTNEPSGPFVAAMGIAAAIVILGLIGALCQ